ncbi:NUDIX hydrolase [Phaeovulum sp.]|uniref:NUDIX hydrolase n=1 Tax=Phaeovulum sp. TaxID=2934796 RepID=UPI0039E390E5
MTKPQTEDKARLRDAATILLVRRGPDGPSVLMGMRGAAAAFMPSKYVFPGGAVDADDALVPLAAPLGAACAGRIAADAPAGLATALAAAAVRELWEETGLMLGVPGQWPGAVPPDWAGFAATGNLPSAAPLTFVFRAITPPGRPRRFDARFFLADAADVLGDPDDFSLACDELSHLHWVPITTARRLNLPFITEVVLAEVAALLEISGDTIATPESVPFFDNSGADSTFRRLA